MKNMIRLIALLSVLLVSVPLFAQTATTQTTLSTAITTTTSNLVTLASGTGVVVGSWLQMDRELMLVTSIANTPTFTVTRTGQGGTTVSPHAAGSLVWVIAGTSPQTLTTVDPGGSCVASAWQYMPIINARNGTAWYCNFQSATASVWGGYSDPNSDSALPYTSVATSQAAATTGYTIKATDRVVVLTTTGTGTTSLATPIQTWVLPSHLGLTGKVLTLKDGSGGVTGTTFIAISGTVDGVGGLLSIVALKTAYGGVQLVAGSGGWFTMSCYKALICQ